VIRGAVVMLLRGLRVLMLPFETMTSVTPRHCKYEPSCSHYAEAAVRRHGVIRGLALAAWRVLRCNPWSRGGYDPVPGEEHRHEVAAP
jgi:putative membrane protein insertion efficiency factor